MVAFTDAEFLGWLQAWFWPFLRIASACVLAPVIGSRGVPARIRIGLALMLTLVVAPLLPAAEALALFSAAWWQALFVQIGIGLCIGFVLLLVFEAVVLGGELIAYSMGLSFAQLADPLRGTSTPVVGQLMLILATLLFVSMNGHLVLIELLLRSFRTLPAASAAFGAEQIGALLEFSAIVFAGGVLIALPVMTALLVANLALGVVSRSAPSLNLFAVGFPVTVIAGLVLLRVGLPTLLEQFAQILDGAWSVVADIGGGAQP